MFKQVKTDSLYLGILVFLVFIMGMNNCATMRQNKILKDINLTLLSKNTQYLNADTVKIFTPASPETIEFGPNEYYPNDNKIDQL